MEERKVSHALQAETELGAATVENSMFLKKLNRTTI